MKPTVVWLWSESYCSLVVSPVGLWSESLCNEGASEVREENEFTKFIYSGWNVPNIFDDRNNRSNDYFVASIEVADYVWSFCTAENMADIAVRTSPKLRNLNVWIFRVFEIADWQANIRRRTHSEANILRRTPCGKHSEVDIETDSLTQPDSPNAPMRNRLRPL